MATEFKRLIIKVSDVTSEVATVPTTNDHTDGSWLSTDIYEGELFVNVKDNVFQTRTESGIITLNGGGGGSVSWGSITGTLSSQTDLDTQLNGKQVTLVSGTNIKTINGSTILGSGDLALTLGSTTFTGLTDTPANFTGQGGKLVAVNSGATALEFVDETDETLIETPTKIGTSRDLILSDRNKNLENDEDITLTVPPNASVAFPVGTQIFFTKKFESLTIAEGSGVTINSVDDLLELDRINCGASLLKIDDDEWNLIGELK